MRRIVVLNVDWLDRKHDFPRGDIEAEIAKRILRLISRQPVNRMRGWHRCNLCNDPPCPIAVKYDGKRISLGSAEIWVEGNDGVQYAAPNLIYHFIVEHQYLPPKAFLDAVARETR